MSDLRGTTCWAISTSVVLGFWLVFILPNTVERMELFNVTVCNLLLIAASLLWIVAVSLAVSHD